MKYSNFNIILIAISAKNCHKKTATDHEDTIDQGWPTCGSLKDYLWLSINVPEFPFHFCVVIFF